MPRLFPLLFLCATALAAHAQSTAVPAAAPAAPADISTPAGDSRMPATPTIVLGNGASNESGVKVTLYGFAEFDLIDDSTQSFTELQGNGAIAKIGTTPGDEGRVQFGARNSRLGLKIESPASSSVKATGNLEMDFLGAANGATESGIYSAPTFRMRHGFVKLQTPFVDLLAGQTWSVLGANEFATPATVEIQGVPSEIYQRTLQLRLGKTLTFGDLKADLELAALRPYQRDAGFPDLGGFLRLEYNGWKGYKATGSTGGDESGIQLAVSGLSRKFRVLKGTPTSTSDFETATGSAIALDAIVPILRASKSDRRNALTLTAEASTGSGYSDAFTSWNGGVTSINAPTGITVANYKQGTGLDPGNAAFGASSGLFGTVNLKSLLVSAQYFLPVGNGDLWVSALFGTLQSDNLTSFTTLATAIPYERWVSLNFFYDVTPAARLGFEWAKTTQRLGDNSPERTNDRAQFSAFYIF